MDLTLESLLPAIVVLMTIIVGTEIPRGQVTAALQMRRALVGATLGQLLLPVLAVVLIWLLRPSPIVSGALLLVAVSPGGGISNYYCALARLNVAFSLLLTTISGFMALLAMPLLFAAILPAALGMESFGVPVAEMIFRLLLFLLLPIAVGMSLRRLYPSVIESAGRVIRAFGLGLLILFLALVFLDERASVSAMFGEAITIIVIFTVLAWLTGWATAHALQLNLTDRTVVAIEFATRNVGIAALLALTTLQQPEFAAFGALFLLFQAPVVLLGLLLSSRLRSLAPRQADIH